jgi:hypothetical protein
MGGDSAGIEAGGNAQFLKLLLIMASGNVNMDFYKRFFLERQHELEEDSQQLLEGELRIQNVEHRQHHRDAHNPSMEPLDYAGHVCTNCAYMKFTNYRQV